MEILTIITDPLQYEFMFKAIVVSAVVGLVCATLSCFMILKKWSLMGDAVSHSVLPGVVLSYIVGLPFSIGAVIFGLISVLLIGIIKSKTRVKEDAAMGIVFTGFFALGLVLISRTPSNIDLMHVLFGYVLGISDFDAGQTLLIGLLTFITLILLRRDLLLFCFDPTHAKSIGINTTFLHNLLLILLSLTVVVALQTVGVILVIAMLITPGSIAYLLTNKFDHMLIIACAASVISCIVGAYLSYYLNVSTGGMIVVLQALIFIITALCAPKYGILKRT